MVIVVQGGDNIINFDNVKSIWIDDDVLDKTNANFEIYADGEILGECKTEKRAKEVLEEIVKKYSIYLELKGGPAILQGQMDIQPNIFNIPKVYEMPEE